MAPRTEIQYDTSAGYEKKNSLIRKTADKRGGDDGGGVADIGRTARPRYHRAVYHLDDD